MLSLASMALAVTVHSAEKTPVDVYFNEDRSQMTLEVAPVIAPSGEGFHVILDLSTDLVTWNHLMEVTDTSDEDQTVLKYIAIIDDPKITNGLFLRLVEVE